VASLNKIACSWQSFPGAPGVSTFYTFGGNLDNDTAALRSFWNSLVAILPIGLTIQVPGVGDVIDDATGLITNSWNASSTPAIVTGTGNASYAGNAGAIVHWLTGGVAGGHRVRGRTFLVPLTNNAFDTQGSIATATLTTIRNAATTLISGMAGDMRVWHRPVGGAGGSSFAVLSSTVPDLAITLRSRRV
jgi:hypothetical protein